VRIKPAYAEAHYNLGLALAKAGRAPEAITEFEAVLRADPDSARTHYNLGVLLLKIGGRKPEALAHFDAASGSVPIRNCAAWWTVYAQPNHEPLCGVRTRACRVETLSTPVLQVGATRVW